MTARQFEQLARTIWDRIPDDYKQGVDGLIIEESSHSHPEHDDFFTLGECVTEAYPSEIGGPDTIRSAVVLYYGSFAAVAAEDPEYAWEAEIEETLLHELQHHLEHLADNDDLADFDHAVEENFKRVEGQPFDPLFFRVGEPVGAATFRVEDDVFVEVTARGRDGFRHELDWAGDRWEVDVPASEADILFAVIEQEMPEVRGDFCIVRVVRKGVLGTLRVALGAGGYSVEEVFVEVRSA